MTQITEEMISKIVSEQQVASLALVDKNGLPHNTPIWVANKGIKLYIFSRASRTKARIASKNNNCMLAFQWAALRGNIEVLNRGTDAFESIKDVMDARYGKETGYNDFKKHWDVALEITPTKIYRN